jgi:hypothetical protein
MSKKWRLSTLVLIAMLASGCRRDVLTPVPAPAMPERLTDLPKVGYILCDSSRSSVSLWEHPGTEPADKDSAYQGHTGNIVGTAQPCEAITVSKALWSEWDGAFYVLVETRHHTGWLLERFVEFDRLPIPSPDTKKDALPVAAAVISLQLHAIRKCVAA